MELGSDREFWLTQGEETLGRGEQCSVQIRSADLSREHVRIRAFSNQWVIEDCGSRNGVWIDDVRVESRSIIASGDIIRFGRVPFRFEALDVAPSELVEPVLLPPKRDIEVESPLNDTSPLELSKDGELVPMRMDEAPEQPLPPEPAGDAHECKEKAILHARLFGVAAKGVTVGTVPVDALSSELPQILGTLVASALEGDAKAARAYLDYASRAQEQLPQSLDLSGSLPDQVERILTAMADRSISPKLALEVLQALETARNLTSKGGLSC